MFAATTTTERDGREELSRQPRARAIATWALVAANLISWGAVAWLYGLPALSAHDSSMLLRVGGVNGDLLRAGEWWRIVTSQFLHVYFAHLIFNMAALFMLGSALEHELGSLRFALLYLVSGSVGQLVGVFVAPAAVASGASQALMGVAGAMPISLLRRRKPATGSVVILLAVIGVQMGLDLATARTIKAGHLSGFFTGAALGYVLSLNRKGA